MSESTTQFPSAERAASAQLAPYGLRLLAFVLDAAMFVVVLVVGVVASVVGQYALDFDVSVVGVGLLALTVFVGFGVMNATLAYLSDGQTVGKAFCGLIERRRACGPDVGTTAGLARLLGRHTVGYLVIDVFGLGALATFRLARRRCLHDLPFDTEVVYVGGDEDRVQRVKALDDRRGARLTEIREQWAWSYHLLKWASGIVLAVVGTTVALLKALGLLSAGQASAPSTAAIASVPAATAPSAAVSAVIVGTSAVLTVVTPPMVAGVLGASQDSLTYSGQGEQVVQIAKPSPVSIARIKVSDNGEWPSNIGISRLNAAGEVISAGYLSYISEVGPTFDGTILIDVESSSGFIEGPTTAIQLRVQPQAMWTIEVSDILDARRLVDGSSGSGHEVFLYEGPGGMARITNLSPPHTGSFRVFVYPTATMTGGAIDHYADPPVWLELDTTLSGQSVEFVVAPGPSVVVVRAGSYGQMGDGPSAAYGQWTISLD